VVAPLGLGDPRLHAGDPFRLGDAERPRLRPKPREFRLDHHVARRPFHRCPLAQHGESRRLTRMR
jgi:hypothetical protein